MTVAEEQQELANRWSRADAEVSLAQRRFDEAQVALDAALRRRAEAAGRLGTLVGRNIPTKVFRVADDAVIVQHDRGDSGDFTTVRRIVIS